MAADRRAEERAHLVPAVSDQASCAGQADAHPRFPERPPDAARHTELETRDRAAGLHDARELAQRRRWILDVAEQVRECERVELSVLERQRARIALLQSHLACRSGQRDAAPALVEHLGALVDADDEAVLLAHQLTRDSGRACRDVEHRVRRRGVDPRDEEPAPARVLAERQHRAPAFVGRAKRREECCGIHTL